MILHLAACFDTIPECDRHIHTDRQTTTAYTTLAW